MAYVARQMRIILEVLDKYIRTGEIEDKAVRDKIDSMHEKNLFKLQLMPAYNPEES